MTGAPAIAVRIAPGPLTRSPAPIEHAGGAVVVFEGVVRPMENGSPIRAIDYEAYEPMATRELHRIGEEVAREFSVLALDATHSTGRVGAGEVSFRLIVVGTHRREAIDALDAFIDRMKRDVPIWKRPVA